MSLACDVAIAGIDGCRAGWVGFAMEPGGAPALIRATSIRAIVEALPETALIAVDMPIGLPERCGPDGRGPEAAVRGLLGPRRSSLFDIPSRAAVWAGTDEGAISLGWAEGHRRANAVARATSDPPRGVSIQGFGIFGKIREVDALLRERTGLTARLFEAHPELAFCRLAGGRPMAEPKKRGGKVNPAGMAERIELLAQRGFPRALLDARPPPGAGADDVVDAAALLFVAARRARGEARPHPDPPGLDAHAIPIAIWA